METKLSGRMRQLIENRKILVSKNSIEMIEKEVDSSKSDLVDAKESFDSGKYKWAIIQGYYAIFHGARALLYSKNFREKSHAALLIALRELFAGKISEDDIMNFSNAMRLRESADYESTFSKESAAKCIAYAKQFISDVLPLLDSDL